MSQAIEVRLSLYHPYSGDLLSCGTVRGSSLPDAIASAVTEGTASGCDFHIHESEDQFRSAAYLLYWNGFVTNPVSLERVPGLVSARLGRMRENGEI